jgi:hypothetical protein
VVFLPFDSPLKTFVCNPAFCQDKVYSAFSGSGAKLSPSAFFMCSKAFRPNLLSSRRSVAPDDSNISAYQSAGDTRILPLSLPFLNVVLMFAIGCRRNKLVSPA